LPIDDSLPHPTQTVPARVVLRKSLAGAPPERQELFDAAVAAALDRIGQGEILTRRVRALVARLRSSAGSGLGEPLPGRHAQVEQEALS
jgi:hypothetical protein